MTHRPKCLHASALRCLINTSVLKLDLTLEDPGHGSDGVIIDLEDGVHLSDKDAARSALLQLDSAAMLRGAVLFGVRINSLRTPHGLRDLSAIYDFLENGHGALSFVQLPKVSSALEVSLCREVLSGLTCPPALMPIVETPEGVENTRDIASVADAMMFGRVDMSASMYRPNPSFMSYARGLFVVSCASYGLAAIDTAAIAHGLDIGDDLAFEQSCSSSRSEGFTGKAVIHPRQVAAVQATFRVTEDELDEYRATVRAYSEATTGFAIVRGKVIAPPFVAHAKLMLDSFAHHGAVA